MNLKKLLLTSTLCLSMISPSVVEAKEKVACQTFQAGSVIL